MSFYKKPLLVPVQTLTIWGTQLRTPITVYVKLTHACNLNCIYCYGKAEKPSPNELGTDEVKRLVDELAEMHVFRIHFFGGEPLLRKDFFELVHYASEKDFQLGVTTTGTLLNREVGESLKTSGLGYATISIVGASSHAHDGTVRVTGAFDRSVNAIKVLKSLGISVGVDFTVTKHNVDEFPKVAELAEKLGVSVMPTWFAMCGFGGWTKNSGMTAEWRRKAQPILVKAKKGHEKDIKMGCWMACGVGRTLCTIAPEGQVIPCEYHPVSVGDIRKQGLQETWLNSDILKYFRTASGLKGRCGKCESKLMCLGGCRVRAYMHYGDLLAPDPTCIREAPPH